MVLRKSLSWMMGFFATSSLIKIGLFISVVAIAISQDAVLGHIVFNKNLYSPYSRLYLTDAPGGSVDAYLTTVKLLDFLDKPVFVGGDCWSACTFFTRLKDKDNVCATKTAMLHFHSFRFFDRKGQVRMIDPAEWERIKTYYLPKDVLDWIDSQGGLPKDINGWLSVPATKFFKECKDPLVLKRV